MLYACCVAVVLQNKTYNERCKLARLDSRAFGIAFTYCRLALAKRHTEYTEQGAIPTDATACIIFRNDCGHHQMQWTNKLLSTRFVQDLPSESPTACTIFQRTKFDENKKAPPKKKTCRHKYVHVRKSTAGEAYNILESVSWGCKFS